MNMVCCGNYLSEPFVLNRYQVISYANWNDRFICLGLCETKKGKGESRITFLLRNARSS